MKKLISLISLLIVFASCKEERNQMKEVVDIHDELMPKMTTIGSLISQLNTADSIKYQDVVNDLKASHNAMMSWMREFGSQFDTDEVMNGKALSEAKQQMLDEQELKVNALKDKINSSIDRAKELLETE